MASRHLTAGLLKYSPELYDQIEQYMLKIYAAMFIPALEKTAADSEQRLKEVKARVEQILQLTKKLATQPSQMGVQQLMGLLFPLAQAGVLTVDLQRLVNSLGTSKAKKGLALLEKDLRELEEAAKQKLDNQAKALREDIDRWREFYDKDVSKRIRQLQKAKKRLPPLTIKLNPEQFPFLQGKFEDNVKKVRGEDAGLFDDLKQIQVKIMDLGTEAAGFWNGEQGEMVVGVPEMAPIGVVLSHLRHTLRHELAHVTQTVMARALGVRHLRVDEDGVPIPAYRRGPGMAPKKVVDPDIHQAFRDVDGLKKRVAELSKYEAAGTIRPEQAKELERHRRTLRTRNYVLNSRGLKSPGATYSLDDLEFYTHLADRVTEFNSLLEDLQLTSDQKELARDLWIGRKWVPRTQEEGLKWIEENDPTHAVWPHFTKTSPFFRHLKKYQKKKYKKAVKEFVKATGQHFAEPVQAESIENLWDEFLKEVYDGGKKTVPNPNHKTREQHPEITVNYLMKQTAPAYSSARAAIRRRFARWRAARSSSGTSK